MYKTIKTETENNIFKQDIVDTDCYLLNKYNGYFLQNSFYEKHCNNIVKYYTDDDNFACEIILHQYLSNKRITLDFDIDLENRTLHYIINNKISLYNYLQKCKNYTMLRVLLNELFSFVNTFKKHNFFHGNLHIGNIFINANTFVLYTIDFTQSHLLQKQNTITDEDLYSLYKSLNTYFTQVSDRKSILYLQSLISTYIK